MTGLFLRYCPACNSATPTIAKGSKCAECEGPVRIVDAFALVEVLGHRLTKTDRHLAMEKLPGHDLPAA